MKGIWNKYKREFVVLIATLAMCVVFTVLNKNFLNYSNFLTVLQQMVLNGILAVGMMFTIITGGIDLSVGCTYAITGIVVASCTVNYGMNPFLAILVGILIGAVLGAFNGFLINQLKLQPFIATLGTMSLYRGIAYVVTGGVPVTNVPTSYRDIFNGIVFGGVRNYIIVMVVVFVIAHILLSKMRSGDYLYAVGGNAQSAMMMGLNVRKTKFKAYLLNGLLAGCGGFLFCLNSCSGFVEQAKGLEMDAISASVIGGTLLSGGVGTPFGTIFGVLIKGSISSLITTQGSLSSWWVRIVLSALLCFFIVLQAVLAHMKRKRAN